jgi:hypothetical protein
MTPRQIVALIRLLLVMVAIGTPLIFWRGSSDPFDLVKATWIGVLGSALLLSLLALLAVGVRPSLPRSVLGAWIFFAVALLIATASSMAPLQSTLGQNFRHTGLITLAVSLMVALAIPIAFNGSEQLIFSRMLFVPASGVLLYGLLQEIGSDPFLWSSSAFGKFVFGTMGNPNTAAGFVAVVSPVAAWTMLRAGNSTAVRVSAGAVFGLSIGMLGAFQSFQGYVALSFAAVYIAIWAWNNGRAAGQWFVGVGTASALFFALTQEGTQTLWVLVLILTAVFAAVGWRAAAISQFRLPTVFTKFRKLLIFFGIVSTGTLGLFAGPQAIALFRRELAQSMIERGDFYRTAWTVFRQYPIFGSGLETFGHVYTLYRPASHAIVLEASRSTSVHSVQLGMFANGGLFLGLSYLAVVATVILVGVKALRRDVHAGSGLLLAVVIAYISYQVQSSVSVEHVALHLLHFTLAGMVLTLSQSSDLNGLSVMRAKSTSRRGRGPSLPNALVVTGLLVWVAMSFFVIARPLRASVASLAAVEAAGVTGDTDTALNKLNRAIELAPWEGRWWSQRAQVKQFTGDLQGAADDASVAASRLRYGADSTAMLARIVFEDGRLRIAQEDFAVADLRLQRTLEIVRRGAANDPFAPVLQRDSAELLAEVAESYRVIGDGEQARFLAQEALTYDPTNSRADRLLNQLNP